MINYRKYKWFYTSSGKLVVGGKSAEQNDELLLKIKKTEKEYVVMHTSSPGSPFCVIISDVKKVSEGDLEECAVFTGCFSRAWKQDKKKSIVDVFKASQLEKGKGMKTGTWSVRGKIQRVNVELKLALVKQKRVLRGVPLKTAGDNKIFMTVCPGKTDKSKMIDKIEEKIGKKIDKNELLSALPAGGVRICR